MACLEEGLKFSAIIPAICTEEHHWHEEHHFCIKLKLFLFHF